MLTRRLLPPEEWPRLCGTELEHVWPLLNDEDARVMVVEDDGQIVACWSAIRYWHLEGVWVHPSRRGRMSVARHLMGLMRQTMRALGVRAAMTGAMSDDVVRLIAHLGGTELPGRHFAVPLGE